MEWEKGSLKVRLLGFWPRYETREFNSQNKDFYGADVLVAFLQKAVSQQVSFNKGLEDEVKKAIEENNLEDTIIKKLSSSVLRGHSLDGTAGLVLGIEGSKFIDPALTGLVNSRSFTTSGRRALIEDIIVPDVLNKEYNKNLREDYIRISTMALDIYKKLVENFGEREGPQIASKMMAYNSSGNLYIVLPISGIISLSNEIEYQRSRGEIFFPREIEDIVDIIEKEVVKEAGMEKIYHARKLALRDSYLHSNVFKYPQENLATDLGNLNGNPLIPLVVNHKVELTEGFLNCIRKLESMLGETYSSKSPGEIERLSRRNLLAFRDFIDRYNDAVSLQTISSLSWRVWGEQKRHATLKQCVESIYMAAERAYDIVRNLPLVIDEFRSKYKEFSNKDRKNFEDLLSRVERAIVVPNQLKKKGKEKLAMDYIDASVKQIVFMETLIRNGIERRDAIYILPRNVRIRTLENYDLYNLTAGELSLRLCSTCEPERVESSEIKEKQIKNSLPDLKNLIGPKCILGYCPESNYCKKIFEYNKDYGKGIHDEIREILLERLHYKTGIFS